MAKKRAARFVCTSCGDDFPKWTGQCPSCQEWNTLDEYMEPAPGAGPKPMVGAGLNLVPLHGRRKEHTRIKTGIGELDRVLGGGAVIGSAILLSGDPGVGKSTLLMQTVAAMANAGTRTVYISAEESVDQVRLRAERLGLDKAPVELDSSTDADAIAAYMLSPQSPDVMIVDSIQTVRCSRADSIPGTVSQVRASAQMLIDAAKSSDTVLILVGHVTKDGQIAGPRVLEHIQDVCLFLEAERGHTYRILRGVKNRFGATDEIGVFEMGEAGLREVPNPSAAFLSDRRDGVPGSAVFCAIEGTRPVLVEVQALIAPSPYSSPKRTVVGYDSGRVSMIMAVLESVGGISLGANDLYINIAGGLKISEPAADLAVAAAVMSAVSRVACPEEAAYFGEIGLTGEIRPVQRSEPRLREANKLGFTKVVHAGTSQASVSDVESLVRSFLEAGPDGRQDLEREPTRKAS